MDFSATVSRKLKYYVYIYSNPLTHEIFYVGKGAGNRAFNHLNDQTENKKVFYINNLKVQGLVPKIEILVHGLEEAEALRVESSIIDLIGINNLTNINRGYESSTFGRMTINQIIGLYEKSIVDIVDPVILIRINKAFRYNMTAEELYEYTRGRWKLHPQRANNAKYGFAVYEGVVQEVYEINQWYKAGETGGIRNQDLQNELNSLQSLEGRFEFTGNVALPEIRDKYRFTSVEHLFSKGNSNPIKYVNI